MNTCHRRVHGGSVDVAQSMRRWQAIITECGKLPQIASEEIDEVLFCLLTHTHESKQRHDTNTKTASATVFVVSASGVQRN